MEKEGLGNKPAELGGLKQKASPTASDKPANSIKIQKLLPTVVKIYGTGDLNYVKIRNSRNMGYSKLVIKWWSLQWLWTQNIFTVANSW